MARSLFFSFIIFFSCTQLLAQRTSDKSEMENERKEIQQEIQQIEQAYNAVKGMSKDNLSQLAALNRKIELQEKYINNIGKEVQLLDDDIYYSAIEIKRLKNQLDTLKAHYARTIVYAYKNRSNYDYLNFIFSANNFNDAIKRVAYLKSYRNYRQQQMNDIVKTRDLIAKRYESQKTTKDKKTTALDAKENEIVVFEKQKTQKDSVAKILSSQANELQKQIAKKKKRDNELRNGIAAIVRKEIAAARKVAEEEARKKAAADAKERADALAKLQAENNKKELIGKTKEITLPTTGTTTPSKPAENAGSVVKKPDNSNTGNAQQNNQNTVAVNNTPAANKPTTVAPIAPPAGGYLNYQKEDIALNADFSQNKGRLPHPVEGVITLGFGRYKIEGVGPEIVGDNPGITYTTAVGADVKVVFDGEVVSVASVGGMSYVVVRHGKYFTVYSNLSAVNVSKGSNVRRGQIIGNVGTDEETGTGKFDFILMIEERNINPRVWLK
jgi:septal ring factor EnvC (AmiA/AmiB activator)